MGTLNRNLRKKKLSSQLLRGGILYCGCLYSLPLSWGWWGLSQLTLEMEWPWGMPKTPLGVVPHLNSTETSLRPRTAESLIMRSNGMSWRELFPLLPYCLIILSQPPVSLESLIPANHAPGKGIKQWQGINGDKQQWCVLRMEHLSLVYRYHQGTHLCVCNISLPDNLNYLYSVRVSVTWVCY